ncbi:MAG: insulinase family protein [Gemmatimonadales bacterium]|nr:insulinase family protein [Gemmatimonadales bacterium]NIN13226.1 insulinase family protein [Gemmatimonadales bacterium]NIN51243.1 insulinase family protein [Gemmatimonadales bacterium]NIP08707.1 insulinase family protein [Gemmatimonadales bacterium]NIR00960.1 insulinase family protein [Gemmatimonadales bacterium]
MKLMIGVAFLLALAGSAAAQQEEGIFPFDYRLVELENGFKAYLIKAGAPGQIAYVSMVRTGSRDEVEEGKSGFAHFFEHMMFRGTDKYPDYDGVTSSMGAARNGFTSSDRTVYYLVASSEYLEQIIDLESDRFMNLKYAEPDFRTEAGAVLGEQQQGAMVPGRWLNEKVRETAYDRHTYRHTTIGYEADVRAMPEGYEYSKSFFRRFYRPENVVLVLVGDFEFDEAEELIRQYYTPWEAGYVPPDVTPEPEQTAPRRQTVRYPGRTLPVLSINYKAPAWSATDRLAVATQVLGRVAFGSNSDLYKRLVIEERKVQYLSAGFGLARDPSLVSINTMVVNPRDVRTVEQDIQQTVERFREELVDETLLSDTKSNMKYGFLMGLETAQNVAFAMMTSVVNTGGIEAVNDYYRTLDSITAEDVREAARRYLMENGKTVVTMVQAGR